VQSILLLFSIFTSLDQPNIRAPARIDTKFKFHKITELSSFRSNELENGETIKVMLMLMNGKAKLSCVKEKFISALDHYQLILWYTTWI
jgi:hypothetical protein